MSNGIIITILFIEQIEISEKLIKFRERIIKFQKILFTNLYVGTGLPRPINRARRPRPYSLIYGQSFLKVYNFLIYYKKTEYFKDMKQ